MSNGCGEAPLSLLCDHHQQQQAAAAALPGDVRRAALPVTSLQPLSHWASRPATDAASALTAGPTSPVRLYSTRPSWTQRRAARPARVLWWLTWAGRTTHCYMTSSARLLSFSRTYVKSALAAVVSGVYSTNSTMPTFPKLPRPGTIRGSRYSGIWAYPCCCRRYVISVVMSLRFKKTRRPRS